MIAATEQWSSIDLEPRRQLAGFQEVFDRTHFRWRLKAGTDGGYFAKVRRREIDEFVITNIVCDPVTGIRASDDVKLANDAYFCLLFFDEGHCALQQGRNESVVKGNSIAIWDSTRPARFENDTRLNQSSLLVPHKLAKTVIPGIDDMCGLSVDGSNGMGEILLSHLRQVHRSIDQVPLDSQPSILRATVELVAAAFQPQIDLTASTAIRRALIAHVQDYVIANLDDPNLSPVSIAKHFRFSPRYLHRLFEEFDVTIGMWIRKRRLLAAQRDLSLTPKFGQLSITEIAMRRGFSDSAHFSRSFRIEFGMSPREFRNSLQKGISYKSAN